MSSFFGDKGGKKESNGDGKADDKADGGGAGSASSGTGVLQPTGGKIDGMVAALVEKMNDSSPSVRKTVARTLQDVGKRQPNLVLSTACEYIQQRPKLVRPHRVALLTCIYQVLELKREAVVPALAVALIRLSMGEMLAERDVVPDWQQAASSVLVSVGMRFPNQILDELLKRFQPGNIPHYFIVKTLGDFLVANPVETVPRLKDAIARVVPVLGMVKHDNMKWVFAAALGHFCDAILTYVANVDSSETTFTVSSFSSDIYPAYEVLFANWIVSAEAKVRLATLQAVGSMCQVISTEQLEANLAKIVPVFVQSYKKEKLADHLPVTEGLNCLLDVGIKDGSRMLDPHLSVILATVHELACQPPDARSSSSVKNYNELFRCFQTLGITFSDQIVAFLLEKLQHKMEKIRIGTLAIIRHLITHIVVELEDKKGLLVSGIKPLCTSETIYAVRRELAQVIIVMASHGYLHLEGGEDLVEFVVRQSAITDAEVQAHEGSKQQQADQGKPPELQCTPNELRSMADNILNLVSSTIEPMENVLWPFLFEFVSPREGRFNEALAIVSKCVGMLGAKKRQDEAADYIIDFDRAVNLPKPHTIIARLMTVLAFPARRNDIGVNVLNCLQAIGPVLHPSISEMWDAAIPKMLAFLDENQPSSSSTSEWVTGGKQSTWEDLVRRLLMETIKLTADADWTTQLGQAYLAQLDEKLFDAEPPSKNKGATAVTSIRVADPDLKRVCFEHLGVCLQRGSHKEFIRTSIERMLLHADVSKAQERDGCAKALGFTAAAHCDMTLEKVHNAIKGPAQQKKSGFLGGLFSGGASKGPNPEQMSPTLILAMGHIAQFAPADLITSRVEISILNHLKPVMIAASQGKAGAGKAGSGQTNEDARECIVKTLSMIAQAVHPSKLPEDKRASFVLKPRDDLLKQLVLFLTGDGKQPVPNTLRTEAVAALTGLVNLPPLLNVELEKAVVERVNTFFSLPEAAGLEKLMTDTHALLGAILARQQASVACLVRQFESLEHYVKSSEGRQRLRSTEGMLFLLRRYIDMKAQLMRLAAEKDKKSVIEARFAALGPCVAMLLPRCGDPLLRVRGAAVEGIQRVLFIDAILQKFQERSDDDVLTLDDETTARLAQFRGIKEQLMNEELDQNEQFAVVSEMSIILSGCVVDEELSDLMQVSLHGLLDTEPSAAAATCVVLNGLIKTRGAELSNAVPQFIPGILDRMPKINSEQATNGALHIIRSLANHHTLPVLDGILGHATLPHAPHVVKAFQAIAKDDDLLESFLNHIIDTLNNSQVYEEVLVQGKAATPKKEKGGKADTRSSKDAEPEVETSAQVMQKMSKKGTHMARSATSAFGSLFALPELEDVVRSDKTQFIKFVGTLLLRVGTANASATCPAPTDDGAAVEEVVTAIKALFVAMGGDKNDLAKALNNAIESSGGWDKLKTEDYEKPLVALCAALCEQGGIALMRPLFDFLQPFLRGNFPEQRIVAATVAAEFVSHCKKEDDADTTQMLALLVNSHLNGLADPVVKLQSLRGLGNIVSCGQSYANQYATTVLDALLSSMDDPQEKLAMEAMHGLAKVFAIVSEERMATILVNICNRMRPAYDMHSNDEIRGAAFRLTGSLARFGRCAVADAFFEQLMTLLPILLVHANDPSEEVGAEVIAALRALAEEGLFRDTESGEDGVDGVLSGFYTEADRFPDMFDYAEFLNDLSKALVAKYPERVNGLVMTSVDYFRSPIDELKCNSVAFVGFLLGALPLEMRSRTNLNPGIISSAIINLLSDASADVRKSAAEAISYLWEF